ncbi:MAG: isochorismatase family protein [Tissierellia bacterium]|jgi:nicotinamidase-related amidase|nr:isochorismatase family protein [Tissierellia bacterium]
MRLNPKSAVMIVIDMQERLIPVISNWQEVEKNTLILLEGADVLGMPVFFSEQYPRGLGSTMASLNPWIDDNNLFEKMSFSLMDDLKEPIESLISKGRHQFILTGIEAHVCVYQTARDLLALGKEVILAYDGVGSRNDEHRLWALKSLQSLGALVLPTESILFDLQRRSDTPSFKKISKLVK